MEQNKRMPQMDLLRLFALLCVTAVHFFLNTEFYDFPVAGIRMGIMTVIRTFCMICVGLFLLLTGYLMGQKRPTVSYYLGIIKVLFIYVLASLCCAGFNAIFNHESLTFTGILSGILGYWSAPYSWYIEMYIGLYLLIPFLNLLYDGLPGQKSKLALLTVLLLMTSVPNVVNIFCFDSLEWWLLPKTDWDYMQILPTFWLDLYPLTFFFLGRYLKDYPVKLGKLIHLGLIVAVALANGAFNFYRSRGTNLIWGAWQTWGALPTVIQAVLVFSFFANLDLQKLPPIMQKGLAILSDWVLGAFLLSWIFDEIFYPILCAAVPVMHLRLVWIPVMAIGVALCSLAASGLLSGIYALTGKKLHAFLRRKFEKQAEVSPTNE